jgi:hypothetical protein
MKIILIIATIMALGFTSAYYEGETFNVSSGLDEIIAWSIINNNSFINATKISNTSISITIPEISDSFNFSVIFKGYINSEEKVQVIDRYIHGGGGIIYKNKTLNNTIYIPYENETKIEELNKIIENQKKDLKERMFLLLCLVLISAFLMFISMKLLNLNSKKAKI